MEPITQMVKSGCTLYSAVKIQFGLGNTKPNIIPFSSFNIHAIQMQWALVLHLKTTKFHNNNVDRSELDS
ncbi:hypothetical protein SFRURICE_014658, partial [Spodoptera frugiperda]